MRCVVWSHKASPHQQTVVYVIILVASSLLVEITHIVFNNISIILNLCVYKAWHVSGRYMQKKSRDGIWIQNRRQNADISRADDIIACNIIPVCIVWAASLFDILLGIFQRQIPVAKLLEKSTQITFTFSDQQHWKTKKQPRQWISPHLLVNLCGATCWMQRLR